MAASEGNTGFGAILSRETSSGSGVYEEIAELTEITSPTQEREEAEFTHHQSPDAIREFKANLGDPGEVAFTCNARLDHASQSPALGIIADYAARTSRNWRITFPDVPPSVCTFPAYVKSYSVDTPKDAAMTLTGTLRLQGAVTWT